MPIDPVERLLLVRIRQGEDAAWQECIARFEGRLFAYVQSRTGDRPSSEDLVQETFLGFLIALPHFDDETPMETFLFSIAAHKLTDWLRSRGRRPSLAFSDTGGEEGGVPGRGRVASSLARSGERRSLEERVLHEGLAGLIRQWQQQGEFERLKCVELIFRLGWPNKQVATQLGLSEQTVANHKHFALTKLQDWVRRSPLGDVPLSEFGLS